MTGTTTARGLSGKLDNSTSNIPNAAEKAKKEEKSQVGMQQGLANRRAGLVLALPVQKYPVVFSTAAPDKRIETYPRATQVLWRSRLTYVKYQPKCSKVQKNIKK